MASDPRSISSASVTAVDFRSGQPVRQGGEAGRELQVGNRFDDFAWQATVLEPPPRASNKVIQVVLALVVVVGFAMVLWFAYQWGLERGYREEVPILRADVGAIKIRPEDPGGLVVPNQDKLVLNQAPSGAETPTIERLLSAPETPQLLPKLDDSTQLAASAAQAPQTPVAASGELPAVPAEPAPEAKTAGAKAAGTKTAETTAKTTAALPTPPPDVAPSAGGQAAAGQGAGGTAQGTGSTTTTGGEGTAGSLQLAAVKQGDFVVQLASVTSDDAAKKEWTRLQKAFPDLLGDMNLSPEVATVKGTEYHRVQTGPFPSKATALDLCAQLQAKNQACIVQQR